MKTNNVTTLIAVVVILFFCISQNLSSRELTLVRDGASDYRLCLPENASPRAAAAAETLRAYLKKISGANLPLAKSADCPERSIVFEIAGVKNTTLPALGPEGFRIKTADNKLYFTAGTDRGIQNAVYTFLETYLGCRKYSTTFEVTPAKPTITLPAIDDTQIPVLTFRMQDIRDSAYNAWHKLNDLDDWGLFVHTFKTLVPPEKYFEDHPEYFSENNGVRVADGQLCLSDPDVFRIVVDELRRRIETNPTARYWSVSQNDTYVPCGCDACRAVDSAEGSPSGSIINFVNRVAREFPDKTISTLAYQYSRPAPVHIKPEPNVNIMLCSIECNRSRSIAEDPKNASFVKDVKDWSRLTDNIFLWDYVVQFRNLLAPFPNLRTLQPNIRFFVENGITSVFEQGVAQMQGEFAELRLYLLAKLLWNPYLDIDPVMTDFLEGYYGEAAPFVRQYIDTMHDALARSGEDLSCFGYPYPSADGYLAAAMLDRYEAIFDDAEAAVKDKPEYLRHVRTARLPVQYAVLEQAKMLGFEERGFFVRDTDGSRRASPELVTLLQIFIDRCKDGGVIRLWEHGISPEEYLAATRRFIESSLPPHLALEKTVTLGTPASPKYHHGQAAALTDGLKGWADYNFHWLGFEGEDMDAVVDLGGTIPVARVETDFLQDILAWVFTPATVEFFVSEDGLEYKKVGEVASTVPPEQAGATIAPFNVEFEPTPARFVKVKTASLKTCPSWHKGSGGKAWIFIDEIKVF
ncbi:MAG: DUF4838 domain-containing protein [Candidatus Zixiibacteriota bacterium]